MCRITDNGYISQFIPEDLKYLSNDKKITYNGILLKTDYIINICHELILKYYYTDEVKHDLWSKILRNKYGRNYKTYLDFLIEKKFLSLVSNYYVGKKCKTFKINLDFLEKVARVKIHDSILLNKYKKEYLSRLFTEENNSPINPTLRKILIDDLYHVELDIDASNNWLENEKSNLTLHQFFKNHSLIGGIDEGLLFYKFDSFGRLHTNFTTLKKYVRKNYLKIDGKELMELDIKNSQPLLLAVLLKKEFDEKNFNEEIKKYIEIVKSGLIYDDLFEKYPEYIQSRDAAKKFVYTVLFGKNYYKIIENKIFQKEYPTVYDYIKTLKNLNGYKYISHQLQLLESNFIFDKVVTEIKNKFPHIRLFTVHDSIIFPVEYKEEVSLIFNNHLKKLL